MARTSRLARSVLLRLRARLRSGADDGKVQGGGEVATVDERVAFLEGRVNEQSQMINGIRDALVSLEQRIDRRFESLEQRLNALDQKMGAGVAA